MGSEPKAFLSLLALVYLGHGVVADILSLQELCNADPSHYMCAGQVIVLMKIMNLGFVDS